jgi:hypothetical protein
VRFTCDGCGKRYATAEEPVPGRVYKLTCKRCGHVIVLRVPSAVVGPAPHASVAGEAPAGAAEPAPPVGSLDRPLEIAPVDLDAPPRTSPEAEGMARTPPPVHAAAAPEAANEPLSAPAPSSDVDLPPLLPEEGEEVAPEPAAAPAPGPADAPSAPGAQRHFELSRMSRPRTGLPLPVILVALLVVVAVVVALIRAERPRTSQPPPAPPGAAAPAR